MDGEIGGRVRYWRLRRNLGRRRFADMVGRSVSWVDKVESGERALQRLPMIERVAEVLGVDPAVLTDAQRAERASQCVDVDEVRAIRQALGQYPGLGRATSDVVDLPAVRRQADYLDHAWLSSRFTVVARHLPALMADAQRVVREASDQRAAYRALVNAYRLASSMLLKFEANDVAWLAADRAMNAALATDDTWSLARATRGVARAMTSARHPAGAITALTSMADRMRAETAANEKDLLALYGMLHLATAIAAAGQSDGDLAEEMHTEALAAASRFGSHPDDHLTAFGMTNVLIHRVAALVRLREAGRALEFAESIPPTAIAVLSAERRSNFLLDLTEARSGVGDHRQAVMLIAQAEQAAPEEVRGRPLAHGLLRSLLENTTGEPARMVRSMAERAGVTA